MVTVRAASPRDLPAITAIYNDAVLHLTATMDTVPKSLRQQRAWFKRHGGRYPVLVAVEAGEVVGWASLSRWSDRPAYDGTSEISVYVREDARGRGIGTRLMRPLLSEGRKRGLHTVIARIAGGNVASVRLHEAFGFKEVGVTREVGFKFGKRIDVLLMQKVFGGRP